MGDQVIHNVLALVMVYDDTSRQWLPCGNALQYANIYILFNETAKIYRFYGIDSKDGEVILDSEIYKGLKYNKATPIFHQWRDISRQVFGLKFESPEDAEGFSNAVLSVLDPVYRSQRKSTEVQPNSTQLSAVTEQSDRGIGQTNQTNNQPLNTQALAQNVGQPLSSQSAVQQIWSSQETIDAGRLSSNVGSRIAVAEPAPAQSRLVHAEPAPAHAKMMPVVEPAPIQTRAALVDSTSDQTRWGQVNAGPGQTGLRRQSSQPSYDQNGPSASLNSSQPSNDEIVDAQASRGRSSSYGNALDDAINASNRLSQQSDQLSSQSAAPPPPSTAGPPPPPPPPIPAGAGSLAEALKSTTLRKTSKPSDEPAKNSAGGVGGGTLPRSAGRGSEDMMSEMARRLQQRRAKEADSQGGTSIKNPSANGSTDEKAPAPSTPVKVLGSSTAGKDSPRSERKWQPPQPSTAAHISSNVPANVATTADLENLKKELTGVMQSEIAAAKQEILDAISKMLNR